MKSTHISVRSKSAAASWENPEVAAKRSHKDHVKVDRYGEFRSVLDAFKQLGLPIGKHGKFRLTLKQSETGRATFKDDHTQYRFRIVKH